MEIFTRSLAALGRIWEVVLEHQGMTHDPAKPNEHQLYDVFLKLNTPPPLRFIA